MKEQQTQQETVILLLNNIDLYERMTHKFSNIALLDIHDFDNLATIFCFDLSASEIKEKWCKF